MGRMLTPRGQQRRDELITYATECFAARGYHATSVADIVQGLGVGKGVFYWYFDSKDRLFVEILRMAQHDLRVTQSAAIGAELDPIRRIEKGIRASLAWVARHPHHNDLIRMAAHEDTFRPHLRRGEAVALADLAKHVADAIADRGLDGADPALLAEAILGVTQRLARAVLRSGGPSPESAADAAVAFCLGGLLGPPARG